MATREIDGEAKALRVLQDALEGEFADKNVVLSFSNWPIIEITLVGKGYDSTVTSDIAEALIEIQNAVNRSYARYVHGSANARTLTAQERQNIKFKAKVRRGSSAIEVNLGDFATRLAQELVGKMDSTELMITVVGLAMVAGSTLVSKAYLKHKSDDKKVDVDTKHALAMSEQETKRLEIVARAMAAKPGLKHTRDEFDDARHEILRSVGDAKSLTVNGVELPRDAANQLAATPRTKSEEVQKNGHYFIQKIDWQLLEDVKLSLKSEDGNEVFVASLSQERVTEEQREILKEAEWGRKAIYMSINATVLRGEVTTARIIAVSWPKGAKTR